MIIKRIKNNMKATFLSLAAFVVAASGVAAMGASPASAAALSGTCASNGYVKVGSKDIKLRTGVVTGSLDIYYSRSTGKNCAMAVATKNFGDRIHRTVAIKDYKNTRSWEGWDGGFYDKYAGPVVTSNSQRGRCIDAYAKFGVESDDAVYGEATITDQFCG